ncbi:MAG: hypothetical protein M1299_09215 [Firmicutes bacterium]|nr:hypothetical protein [Bacillota bacterium]MCL5039985.1 hypothetical protein [Bacillota bacterium]
MAWLHWREIAYPGSLFSSGAILFWQNRLLFAVGSEKYWASRGSETLVSFWGLGGRQEPGESLLATLRREVGEEANCQVRLRDSRRTYLMVEAEDPQPIRLVQTQELGERTALEMDRDSSLGVLPSGNLLTALGPAQALDGGRSSRGSRAGPTVPVAWMEEVRPLLFWKRVIDLKDELGEIHQTPYFGVAFLGGVEGEPRPGAEIPALLALSHEQLLAAESGGTLLTDLLQGGATLIGGRPLPAAARLFPYGTAGYLARLLRSARLRLSEE